MLTLKSLRRKIDIIRVYHSSQKCLSLYIQSHNTPMSVGHRGHFLCLHEQTRQEFVQCGGNSEKIQPNPRSLFWLFCLRK